MSDKVKTVGHGNGVAAILESLNSRLLKGAIVARRCIAITSTVCMSSRPGTAGWGLLGRSVSDHANQFESFPISRCAEVADNGFFKICNEAVMLKFTLCPAVPNRVSRVTPADANKAPLTGMCHFLRWCLVCILVFCSGSVFAQTFSCSSTSGGNYAPDIGTVVTNGTGARFGDVVISKKVPGPPYEGFCKESSGTQDREATVVFSVEGEPFEGYTDVYPTNVDGLGVRYTISKKVGGGDCGAPDDRRIATSYSTKCWVRTGTTKTWSWEVYMDFIKIKAKIVAGALTKIPAVKMSYTKNTESGTTVLTSMYTGAASGNVASPTCTTPDVVIPMGNVNFATFNKAGVANGQWNNTTFYVNNCPAGLDRVTIQFDTPLAGWLDETNGVFKLNSPTDAATAKGIGIQMSFGANNALVTYGSAQTLNGYDENKKQNGGTFTVPIGARYVKPASTLKLVAGQANGSVSFVMSYE